MILEIVILFIVNVFLPISFLIALWKGKFSTKIEAITKVSYTSLFIIYIFVIGRWDWIGFYLRFLFLLFLLLTGIQSIRRVRSLAFRRNRKLKDWISITLGSLLTIWFGLFSILALKGHSYNAKAVELTFPLHNGIYYIAQGGNSALINYHNVIQPQRYALDIVKLNAFGTRAKGIHPKNLHSYAVFGDLLHSPCSGTVLAAEDGFPDLIPPQMDSFHLAGNHVFIRCNGVEIILAHMKKDSVMVKEGQSIRDGQAIGRVGNSGNSSEPHLHIHARKIQIHGSILDGVGVPMLFNGRFLVRNSLIRSKPS